jgi:hypothetical protein
MFSPTCTILCKTHTSPLPSNVPYVTNVNIVRVSEINRTSVMSKEDPQYSKQFRDVPYYNCAFCVGTVDHCTLTLET